MTATLKDRAAALRLHGLLDRWDDITGADRAGADRTGADWLEDMIAREEQARGRRSFERRSRGARLPAFRPLADFDWTWPRAIDRAAVERLMRLDFIAEANNAVLVGGQGTGKTMIAVNIAHQALVAGHTVRFEKADEMLPTLAAIPTRAELMRRITALCRPRLLVLDRIGYVTLNSRHADILFTIVARRYQKRSTLITTTLAFGQWDRVFPGAAAIAGTVDRLVHNATIITIDGESWRLGAS